VSRLVYEFGFNKMNPESELDKGVALLDPVMNKNGFQFVFSSKGNGSGGLFAAGYYEKGNRRLNMSVRYSLGCVTYQFEGYKIYHEDYLRAVRARGEYPGFSKQVIEAFGHLLDDLQGLFSVFLSGRDEALREIYSFVAKHPEKTGFKALT